MFRPALPLALFVLASSGLFAAPLKSSYILHERGARRELVIAQDEIHRARQAVSVPAVGSVEDARRAAELQGADLVMYEKGAPRNEHTRRLLTKRIAVQLADSTDANATAAAAGATNLGPARSAPGWFLFESGPAAGSALEATERLRRLPGVLGAEPQLARLATKHFTPDDTFYADQWTLHNTGSAKSVAGIDLNITSVWDTYTGNGVTIGIVDDGCQYTHPDLAANYRADVSYDFNYRDSDPLPAPFTGDNHGTAVASLAVAKGNNAAGITGVAFNAQFAALRLISFATTDADDAAAFGFRNDAIAIKSNSWGIPETGRFIEGPGPLAIAALEDAVKNGRGGKGTIFVFSAGNGAQVGETTAFNGYTNRPETIAVGAVDSQGKRAFYSNIGASILCVAPSSGTTATLYVPSADRPGYDGYNPPTYKDEYSNLDYTRFFGGTSAAAPEVAGVIALMLQANAALGWRDVQEILIRTARKIESADPGWVTNGATFHFNDNFGAGLIDAAAAVTMGKTWTNLPPALSLEQEQANLAAAIPDYPKPGLVRTFPVSDARLRVEHVTFDLDILHARRGQVEVIVESPSGTKARMVPTRPRDTNPHILGVTFMTPHFWGETADGTWKVTVTDKTKGTVGTLQRLRLKLHGSSQTGHGAADGFTITGGDLNNNGFVDVNETVTVDFKIRNDGNTAFTALTASLTGGAGISNATPVTPVVIGSLAPGATATATFSFKNTGALGTTIVPMIELKDGLTTVGTVPYPIAVGVIETQTFSTNESIVIPGFPGTSGKAFPYAPVRAGDPATPSVNVTTPSGSKVVKVVMHLNHLSHGRSADLDVLLVSAAGGKAIVMSDAGGFYADDIEVTLDDAAERGLPSTQLLYTGAFRPTNHGATIDTFPAPAPPRPYGANLATFQGENPQGLWRLFIVDDLAGASSYGGLGSWSLDVTYAH